MSMRQIRLPSLDGFIQQDRIRGVVEGMVGLRRPNRPHGRRLYTVGPVSVQRSRAFRGPVESCLAEGVRSVVLDPAQGPFPRISSHGKAPPAAAPTSLSPTPPQAAP